MPSGEYKGQPWRRERLPWARALFDLLDEPHWLQVVTTGPTQSGKTQQCLTIPTLRRVREFPQHNIVLGFPDGDMADKKFRTDFLPVLESSPGLRALLPKGGVGSKGGKIKDSLTFGNGVLAALMSKGAKDEGKAGFSAPYAAITEAGGFSEGTETSHETDPFRQIKGRLLAYQRKNRRVQIEGTVKIESMLPWSLRGRDDGPLISSQSRLVSPCPHCGEWISPEREHFVGWQEAASEDQAANESTFVCPCCAVVLTEGDRAKSNRDLRVVHRGQTINKNGDVEGDRPPTSTLWFRYSQWHNLLTSYGDIAASEWEATQSAEGTSQRDNLERALHQQTWCIPFESSLVENVKLDAALVKQRKAKCPRNVLPEDTVKVTIGVDLGDWTGWWVGVAWRANGVRHVFGYGMFDVKQNREDDADERLRHALEKFAAEAIAPGFVQEGMAVRRAADLVWIDGNYCTATVSAWIRTQGAPRSSRYRFARGAGRSSRNQFGEGEYYSAPRLRTKSRPKIGKEWYANINFARGIQENTFNADYWKLSVDEGLLAKPDTPGAIVLFEPSFLKEHDRFANHMANEHLERQWIPGQGEKATWKRNGAQHWKDALAMASAAGDEAGAVSNYTVVESAGESSAPTDWESLR